jgi:hypothetical protein
LDTRLWPPTRSTLPSAGILRSYPRTSRSSIRGRATLLIRWFPQRIEGSLAAGTRSVLIFPDQRVWWDVTVLESDRRFEFHWPWLPGETWETTVSVLLEPAGYGTLLTLTDGPFDLRVPGVLDAYAEALEGWGEALAWLRGVVDFSSDLRPRQY